MLLRNWCRMALSNNVRDVLALIEDMRLPHPGEPLLASFIKDAVDPDLAANYVWGKVLERNEQSLVPDWTYIVQSRPCPVPTRFRPLLGDLTDLA